MVGGEILNKLAMAVERMGLFSYWGDVCYLIINFLMVGDVERRTK